MEGKYGPKPTSAARIIRRDRFSKNTEKSNIVSLQSFALGESYDSLVIDTWKHNYWSQEGIEFHLRPSIFVHLSFRQVVEQAIKGILIESQHFEEVDISKAKEMVSQLSEILRKDEQENLTNEQEDDACVCCAHLYTLNSFLFKLVNDTLRNQDLTKIETVGAYCWLLQSYIGWSATIPHHITTVYRGCTLRKDEVEEYKQAIGQIIRWHAFTSTTKSREVAESYSGNTLFIITLDKTGRNAHHEHDISSVSQFPDEEEILLVPDHNFIVENVEDHLSSSSEEQCFIYLRCNHPLPVLPDD